MTRLPVGDIERSTLAQHVAARVFFVRRGDGISCAGQVLGICAVDRDHRCLPRAEIVQQRTCRRNRAGEHSLEAKDQLGGSSGCREVPVLVVMSETAVAVGEFEPECVVAGHTTFRHGRRFCERAGLLEADLRLACAA